MDAFHFLPARTAPSVPAGALWAAAVTNWTVTEPGATKAPTTNDYDQWNMDQLRKECTARGKKIKRNTEDEGGVRRSWLRESDLQRRGGRSPGVSGEQPAGGGRDVAVGQEVPKPQTQKPKALKPDSGISPSRVVHVIASDAGAVDGSGKPVNVQVSAAQVEDDVTARSVGVKRVWEDTVRESTASRLVMPPPMRPTKLVALSPQGPTGGVRTSSDRHVPLVAPDSPTSPTRCVAEVLDCLSKTYAIWIQLQATISDMETHGRQAPMLRNSITLLEAGLGALEQEYATALGIDMPHTKSRTSTSSQ